MANDNKGSSKVPQKKKNLTWNRNHQLIHEAYLSLINELKRCPTIEQVSKRVRLSERVIKLHIRELKFAPLESPLRVLTPDVLVSIYASARKGSAQSQKLWMQVMEGWNEKKEIEHSGEISNVRGMTPEERSKRKEELLKKFNG